MTNIALVVLDNLRKDYFDKHFQWVPGRRFERAFSTGHWSVPSHASLFTGKYASEIGVHAKNLHLDCKEPVLAERLSENGYTTRAYSANPITMPLYDFGRGFTDFRAPEKLSNHLGDSFCWRQFIHETDATGVRLYLEALVALFRSESKTIPSLLTGISQHLNNLAGVKYGGAIEAFSELRTIDFSDEEFLFLNLMEAHGPYRVPEKYMSIESPEIPCAIGDFMLDSPVETERAQRLQRAYEACAQYLSDEYKRIFDLLRDEFDYIITLSDHGQMLGEHGTWGHEYGVYRELTHVPLCISGGDLDGSCTEAVSLCDVPETILDIAGCEPLDGQGQTLLGTVDRRGCLTEYLGLTPWSEQRIKENAPEKLDRYERPLRGYAEGGYYGYETIDGFEEEGDAPVDFPRERLASLVESLRIGEQETEAPATM